MQRNQGKATLIFLLIRLRVVKSLLVCGGREGGGRSAVTQSTPLHLIGIWCLIRSRSRGDVESGSWSVGRASNYAKEEVTRLRPCLSARRIFQRQRPERMLGVTSVWKDGTVRRQEISFVPKPSPKWWNLSTSIWKGPPLGRDLLATFGSVSVPPSPGGEPPGLSSSGRTQLRYEPWRWESIDYRL